MNYLTPTESSQAVRLGVARAMSEAGLTPSQAEDKLASLDMDKEAGMLDDLAGIAAKIPLVAIGVGGIAGAYAGKLHHQADRALAGDNDPDITALRRKTDEYHKMTADLALGQAAGKPV